MKKKDISLDAFLKKKSLHIPFSYRSTNQTAIVHFNVKVSGIKREKSKAVL